MTFANYYYILFHITIKSMKKLLTILALVAMLSLASCNKEATTVDQNSSGTDNEMVETPAEVPAE